jgi:GAF domain-containing protein
LVSSTNANQSLRQIPDASVGVEQVRLLYGSPIIVLINPINACIVAALLWPMYPVEVIIGWVGLFVVVIGARVLLAYRFRRQQQPVQDAGRWGLSFAFGAFVTGCLWGLLVSIIFVTDDPVYHVFVLFVLGGMTAGAAMQSSAYLPAFYGFAVPALLPMIVMLLTKEGAHSGAMALLLTTFAAVLLIMGRDNNRRITENIRLRIEQGALNEELRRHEQDMLAIARLSDMLQSCHSLTEAYPIIALTANNVFPEMSGALALIEGETHTLKTVIQWGTNQVISPQFVSDDCWALRVGRSYEVSGPGNGAACRHFKSVPSGPYVCLPLIVQGETSGLLHLNIAAGDVISEELHRQMLSFGDVVKLSLSNLKLRESLIEQAMRDQLTGLFNRHYLVETLPREIQRAQRNGAPLTIAMLDIDHFKMFNDTQGHDAGDFVL